METRKKEIHIDEVLIMAGADSGNEVTYGDYYYAQDHLYSSAALIEDDGDVAERYEYDAYGNCHVLDPDFSADADGLSDYNNPYTFTGRRLDVLDTGKLNIMYYRHRSYHPQLGRFLQHDPFGIFSRIIFSSSRPFFVELDGPSNHLQRGIGPVVKINQVNFPQARSYKRNRFLRNQYISGLNLYAYGANCPLVWVDPFGLKIVYPKPDDDDSPWPWEPHPGYDGFNSPYFYDDCMDYCKIRFRNTLLSEGYSQTIVEKIINGEICKKVPMSLLRKYSTCKGNCYAKGLTMAPGPGSEPPEGWDPWPPSSTSGFVVFLSLFLSLVMFQGSRTAPAKKGWIKLW